MNPDRWNKIQTLFKEIINLDFSTRATRLLELRDLDPEMHKELMSLLAADADTTSILDGTVTEALDLNAFLSMEGTQIGQFELVELIGFGGMGSVYCAKRIKGGFEQEVALKLIKQGIDSEPILHRFRSERSILARLEHPNIARLVDGGITEDDRPWFAMEFVHGEPITSFTAREKLSVNQCLKLFEHITSAVQYAHRNLIIHRDLKPENIFVSGDASSPTIKLLDFGIAQIVDDIENQLTGSSGLTMAYASPEQKRGEPTTTLTDIYSLGVVLYQLLAGEHPNPEYRREEQEVRPVDPELESICRKAMEEKPEDRYETVADMSNDINNWKNDEPVDSYSEKGLYIFRKFMKRNQTPVSIAAIGIFAVILLTFYYTDQLQQEKEIAEQEARRAERIASVLGSSLGSIDPRKTSATELSAKKLLDNSLNYIGNELEGDPATQASLYGTLAGVYSSLAFFNEADSLSQLRYDHFIAAADTDNVEYLYVLTQRSDILMSLGKFDEAGTFISKAVSIADQHLDDNSLNYADILLSYNNYLYEVADFTEADSVLKIIKPIFEANRETRETDYQDVVFFLGTNYRKLGIYDSAEVYLMEALRLSEETFEAPNEMIASNLNHVSSLYQNMGEPERALPFAIASYEQRRQIFGEDHISTIASQANTARTYSAVGDYEKSAEQYEQVVEKFRRLYGEENFNLAGLTQSLGNVYSRMGNFEEAEKNMRKSLELSEKLLPPEDFRQSYPIQGMADMYRKQGRFDEALPYAERALENRELTLEENNALLAQSRLTVGVCLWNLGRQDEAREHLQKARALYDTDPELYASQLEIIEELGI